VNILIKDVLGKQYSVPNSDSESQLRKTATARVGNGPGFVKGKLLPTTAALSFQVLAWVISRGHNWRMKYTCKLARGPAKQKRHFFVPLAVSVTPPFHCLLSQLSANGFHFGQFRHQ
jgi:hypothetical protein